MVRKTAKGSCRRCPWIEEIPSPADRSVVNPWQIEDASLAEIRDSQPAYAVAWPQVAPTGAPLLTQIEQLLGRNSEPDAAFFMDCWTAGRTAASESFLRRHGPEQPREHEIPPGTPFSWMPFMLTWVEDRDEATAPLRQPPAAGSSTVEGWHRDEERQRSAAANEPTTVSPTTLESACQVLGVSSRSTREQVRAAYRRMAGRYHPDRLAACDPREQKQASDRMASINDAYRLFCAALPE